MKCHVCRSEMRCGEEVYHYLECGLDNVFLSDVEICRCDCGEEIVSIPATPDLHSLIGLDLLKKKSPLNDKEIRFLRKNIGLTATLLSKYLGVEIETVSRWENGKTKPTLPHDRLIRMIYANIKGIPPDEIRHFIENDFAKIDLNETETPIYTIPSNRWSNSIVCKR